MLFATAEIEGVLQPGFNPARYPFDSFSLHRTRNMSQLQATAGQLII